MNSTTSNYYHVLSYNNIYGLCYENMTNMTIRMQPHHQVKNMHDLVVSKYQIMDELVILKNPPCKEIWTHRIGVCNTPVAHFFPKLPTISLWSPDTWDVANCDMVGDVLLEGDAMELGAILGSLLCYDI